MTSSVAEAIRRYMPCTHLFFSGHCIHSLLNIHNVNQSSIVMAYAVSINNVDRTDKTLLKCTMHMQAVSLTEMEISISNVESG